MAPSSQMLTRGKDVSIDMIDVAKDERKALRNKALMSSREVWEYRQAPLSHIHPWREWALILAFQASIRESRLPYLAISDYAERSGRKPWLIGSEDLFPVFTTIRMRCAIALFGL